jgi:hypothetical protein
MKLPLEITEAFPPCRDLSLDRTRSAVDDEMLIVIARADYGHMANEMLAELRPIRDQGNLPTPISYQLGEVLELTRWSDPDHPNAPPFEPGPSGSIGHYIRLFACAVLLRAAAEPCYRYEDMGHDSTLSRSFDSAMILGTEMEEALACIVTWRLSHNENRSEAIYLLLLLLVLSAKLWPAHITEQAIGSIAEMLLMLESEHRNSSDWNSANPKPIDMSLQMRFWRRFVKEIHTIAAGIGDEKIRTNLNLCSLILE